MARAIGRHGLFAAGERIVVAVSGGADSVALLYALAEAAPRHGWQLAVAHFNHQLRGKESDGDEAFVAALAKKLGLPFHRGSEDVAKFGRKHRLSLEMAARECRHRFLARIAHHMGARTIALGHHADDQLELFFLRLLRGTGSEGLGGMAWSNASPFDPDVRLVRPFLEMTRRDIVAYLKAAKLRFRHDRTNDCLDMQRNWLRKKLLPQLLRRQPGAPRSVSRLMEIVGAEADFVAQQAEQSKQADFEEWHVALQRKRLQAELLAAGHEPQFDLIEQLRLKANAPVACGKNRWLERTPQGTLRQVTPRALGHDEQQLLVHLTGKAGAGSWGGLTFRWRLVSPKGKARPAFGPGREYFDGARVGATLCLRHWQPGDRMQPIGMPASVKLQDLFTNQKVPAAKRRRAVVAASAAGEIFWVEGLRIAERFKLDRESAVVLEWEWKREW